MVCVLAFTKTTVYVKEYKITISKTQGKVVVFKSQLLLLPSKENNPF